MQVQSEIPNRFCLFYLFYLYVHARVGGGITYLRFCTNAPSSTTRHIVACSITQFSQPLVQVTNQAL
jgi:hypothetical protein